MLDLDVEVALVDDVIDEAADVEQLALDFLGPLVEVHIRPIGSGLFRQRPEPTRLLDLGDTCLVVIWGDHNDQIGVELLQAALDIGDV